MELAEVLSKINKERSRIEACFVFSLWKEPELYESYLNINENGDNTLTDGDAKFYFHLGKSMYKQGYRDFDFVTIETFLSNKPELKKKYDGYGGYREVDELKNIMSADNSEAYYDKIVKMNMLSNMAQSTEKLFSSVERFDSASSDDVYNAFELLNNNNFLTASHNEKVEDLVIDEQFVSGLESGESVGFNYGRYAPLLNYITLGLSPGLYMVGGHSGTGKSSFVFSVMIMGLHYAGIPCAIISNEMKSDTYKVLLLEHILTKDMDYWGLTRKQIRIGKYSPEQKEKIEEAMRISREKYSDIKFIKVFDNNIDKILKYLHKLKAQGVSAVLYDTFKSDDMADTSQLWQSLMLDARRLFQACSKLDMACITTYQLALHTTNQRYLDASCLSNSKQIKEVYETMIYFRPLWDDEYTGQKYDVKAYKLTDNNKVKESLVLDPNEKYLLVFIDKTRSDEDKQVLIYQWRGRFNHWRELGFAKVVNEHRNF